MGAPATYVMIDHDAKCTANFDAVLATDGFAVERDDGLGKGGARGKRLIAKRRYRLFVELPRIAASTAQGRDRPLTHFADVLGDLPGPVGPVPLGQGTADGDCPRRTC